MADLATIARARREVDARLRALAEAQRASDRATEARAALPAGSSRARVTTANARWMRAAEYRDICEARVREVVPEFEKIGGRDG